MKHIDVNDSANLIQDRVFVHNSSDKFPPPPHAVLFQLPVGCEIRTSWDD